MNPRERKLAIIVGLVGGIALVIKVVYPSVIRPMVDIKDQIAELEDELFEQQEEAERFDLALLDYKRLVERTGSTDPRQVGNRLHARLDALARKAGLDEPRVTVRNARRDKRLGSYSVPVAIKAEGTLKQTIDFLKSCYELPYAARFADLKFSPTSGSKSGKNANRGKSNSDRVKLVASMEVIVLPRDIRAPIDLETIQQPEKMVKYGGKPDSYAMIWGRQPFSKYVKNAPKPRAPTPKTPPKKIKPKPTPTPVRTAFEPRGDRDAKHKTVVMALSYGVDELLIVNERGNTQEYVATGEDLDGGKLVLVHPYGGVVRKDHGDFFYEVGTKLSEAIPVAVADDFPEVKALARRLPDVMPDEPESGQPGDDPADDDQGSDDEAVAGEPKMPEPKAGSPRKPHSRKPYRPSARSPRTSHPTKTEQKPSRTAKSSGRIGGASTKPSRSESPVPRTGRKRGAKNDKKDTEE